MANGATRRAASAAASDTDGSAMPTVAASAVVRRRMASSSWAHKALWLRKRGNRGTGGDGSKNILYNFKGREFLRLLSLPFLVMCTLNHIAMESNKIASAPATRTKMENKNQNQVDPKHDEEPAGGSVIEDSRFHDDFAILRNVCLVRSKSQQESHDTMLFFSPTIDGREKVESAMTIFDAKREATFSHWESDIPISMGPALGSAEAELVESKTMHDWMDQNDGKHLALNGTTIIREPHHPDNNFHLLNDLTIPSLYQVIKSKSRNAETVRLLLTHGSKARFNNRVVAFDILYKLFDEVMYPMEKLLTDHGSICFDRLVWGKRIFPYYSDWGRFGRNDKWNGVLPEIRDWINDIYGVGRARNQTLPELQTFRQKPKLTFIDRPCQGSWNSSDRCIQNPHTLLALLSSRFNVSILSFNIMLDRPKQIQNMLEIMADTNVLVGIHGAGLAHIAYLPEQSIVVEIKKKSMREKKLFLNMASKQDIGYYALEINADAGGSFSENYMRTFVDNLWLAWKQEVDRWSKLNGHNAFKDLPEKCLFPQHLSSNSPTFMSSFGMSRCYLEKCMSCGGSGTWNQCDHYNHCAPP